MFTNLHFDNITLQHHRPVRVVCDCHRELRAAADQRPSAEHLVHPPAPCGSHPQAVQGHLPGQAGQRVPAGGGTLLQAHLPLPLPGDPRQVDQAT